MSVCVLFMCDLQTHTGHFTVDKSADQMNVTPVLMITKPSGAGAEDKEAT